MIALFLTPSYGFLAFVIGIGIGYFIRVNIEKKRERMRKMKIDNTDFIAPVGGCKGD